MGRIKTTPVKNAARDIIEKHGDRFTTDFSKNKTILKELYELDSKKQMNVVTGYITKLKKQEQRM